MAHPSTPPIPQANHVQLEVIVQAEAEVIKAADVLAYRAAQARTAAANGGETRSNR